LAYFVLDNLAAEVIPAWTVREKYYWSETFPAHKTVFLKNESIPFSGRWEVLVSNDGSTLEDSANDRKDS
jgi:hypothetical protein